MGKMEKRAAALDRLGQMRATGQISPGQYDMMRARAMKSSAGFTFVLVLIAVIAIVVVLIMVFVVNVIMSLS